TWADGPGGMKNGKSVLIVKLYPSRISGKPDWESSLKDYYKGVMITMPVAAGLSDFRQTEPEKSDINGIPFVHGKWSGLLAEKLVYGFTYITATPDKTVNVTAVSPDIPNFRVAEAAMNTFHK